MSVCGQNEEDTVSVDVGVPLRDIYEQKAVSKVVRVLTVLAYLLSVSLAAILLSVYYICVWKSPELPPLNDTEGQLSARRGHLEDYQLRDSNVQPSINFTGRSNSTVNEVVAPPTKTPTGNISTEGSVSDTSNATEFSYTTAPDTTPRDILNATSDDIDVYNATNIT